MGQASSFYEFHYVVSFSTDNPEYPGSPYFIGNYSSAEGANRVCDEYKSGAKQFSIRGKSGSMTPTKELTGSYTVRKEHIV